MRLSSRGNSRCVESVQTKRIMERVADYVINRLVEEGVKTVFLITGRGILYLSDAIAKNEELQSVSVHHEQAAAFAANAYSQYSENLALVLFLQDVLRQMLLPEC